MKTIKIIIEASKDAFGAYAESNKYPITAMGSTVQEVKESILECIELNKQLGNIPNQEFTVQYKYDTKSLLAFYNKIITKSALERVTGINQKQIQHYATGLKRPRPAQVKKIKDALHKLGRELLAVEL